MIFKGIQKTSFVDYPGKVSAVLFTGGCNFKCSYCHNNSLVNINPNDEFCISEDEIFTFLEKRKKVLDAVVISGGEPSLHGEVLIDFIRKVKLMGFSIKLDSNGTNPNFVLKLLNEKLLDYIAMDIKAPLVKYKEVINAEVNIEDIKKSINIIKLSGIPYEFRTTVCAEMLSKSDIYTIINEISPCTLYCLQNFRDGDTVLEGKGKFTSVKYLEEIALKHTFVKVR